jgi:HAD superfamily hydrolase (TIGR01490 family)
LNKLAIFDVDFTLTKRETLMEFYIFMIKKDLKLIKYLPRSLGATLLYISRIFDAQKAKEYFIAFIDGIEEKKMKELVKEFYEKKLSKIFYKDAMDMMKRLKGEGFLVYLISASAEFYLNELYNIKEVDKVIGTRFKCDKGIHRRNMEGVNCKGEEKVTRLMEILKEEKIEVDFKNSYMFSDSLSDLPLLNLVGNPFLINYKKGHKTIKNLNWR